jgi:uncharacterized protein YhdP
MWLRLLRRLDLRPPLSTEAQRAKEEEAQSKVQPKRHAVRALIHACIRLAVLWCVLVMIAGAGIYWISSTPRSFPKLDSTLHSLLARTHPEVEINWKHHSIHWPGLSKPLFLTLSNITVHPKGKPGTLSVNQATVGIDPLSLALGKLSIRNLEVIEPHATLTRLPDGRWWPKSGEDEEPLRFGNPTEMLAMLGLPDATRLVMKHANVILRDGPNRWELPADVALERSSKGIIGKVEGELRVFASPPSLRATNGSVAIQKTDKNWIASSSATPRNDAVVTRSGSLLLTWSDHPAKEGSLFTAEIHKLTPSSFALLDPALAEWKGYEFPANLNLTGDTDRFGNPLHATLKLTAGPGDITHPRFFPKRVPLTAIVMHATIDGPDQLLSVRDGKFAFVDTIIHFEGGYTYDDTAPGMDIKVNLKRLPLFRLVEWWPITLAPHARHWVTTNIKGGKVPTAWLETHLPKGTDTTNGLPPGTFKAEVVVDDTTVRYLPDMPLVEEVDGVAHFTEKELTIDVSRGQAWTGMKLQKGALRLPDMMSHEPEMVIDLDVTGPASDIARFIDHPRFKNLAFLNVHPANTKGDAKGKVWIRAGLNKSSHLFEHKVDATVTNLAIPDFWNRVPITGGTLRMKLENEKIDLALKGNAFSHPVEATVKGTAQMSKGVDGIIKAEGRLPVRDLPAFGVTPLEGMAGSMGLTLTHKEHIGKPADGNITLNLADTVFVIAPLDYRKESGQAGRVTADYRLGPKQWSVSNLQVTAPTLTAAGGLTIDREKGRMGTLDLTSVRVGERNDFALQLTPTDTGENLNITGKSLDVGAWIQKSKQGEKQETPEAEKVTRRFDLALDNLHFADRGHWRSVKARGECREMQCRSLDVSANMEGNAPLVWRIARENGVKKLTLSAKDAGQFLNSLDIVSNIDGGTLLVEGHYTGEGKQSILDGTIRMEDFNMRQTPLLARLFMLASIGGILDILQGKGLGFDQMVAPFHWEGEVMQFHDTNLAGSALGITAAGEINSADNHMKLSGALVPAYTLNSLVGKIPVLGEVLIGGKGEGLFAVNYTVSGPPGDPDIRVNPLSILTPGLFRGLFDVFEADEAPAKPTAAATPP